MGLGDWMVVKVSEGLMELMNGVEKWCLHRMAWPASEPTRMIPSR
jgi:hypothetical protein